MLVETLTCILYSDLIPTKFVQIKIYQTTSDYVLQKLKKDNNISVIDASDSTSSYELIKIF